MTRSTYTIAELAPILGCSANHLYSLAARGELPGVVRLGTKIVVSKAAIDTMLGQPGEASGE